MYWILVAGFIYEFYIVQTYCVNLNKWHYDVCGSWAADPAVEASYVYEQQKIKSKHRFLASEHNNFHMF